jgi:biotin carboxyl carrier protein
MPCQIVDVLKNVGESVEKGEKILVIEAMKTQQSFSAPFAGTLSLLNAKKGNQVAEGDLLAIVTKSE